MNNRINLVAGKPEISGISDALWAKPEAEGWRVYAAYGESTAPACSRFIKAASADAAIQKAWNPFGDLSTGGWRDEAEPIGRSSKK